VIVIVIVVIVVVVVVVVTTTTITRGDHFQFDSVFIKKKATKPKKKIKKKRKHKPVQTDQFRFSLVFLEQKPVQTGLARFFWFGSVFFGFGLARFFSVWVRFGFFSFRLIKPKPNQTGRFFQNSNRFFLTIKFFRLFFFPVFSI
jgi:hypothetical protein